MPGDQTGPEKGDDPVLSGSAVDEVRDFLVTELRAAISAAIRSGADPEAVTADLEGRLRQVRRLLAEAKSDSPGPRDEGHT